MLSLSRRGTYPQKRLAPEGAFDLPKMSLGEDSVAASSLVCQWDAADQLWNTRQALRYIIRNTTLPARTRAEAQLQLTQMHCYTRPTQIRNRCILGGKGRGILSDFKMSRVRSVRDDTRALLDACEGRC